MAGIEIPITARVSDAAITELHKKIEALVAKVEEINRRPLSLVSKEQVDRARELADQLDRISKTTARGTTVPGGAAPGVAAHGTAAPGVAAQGVPQFPGMPGMPGVRGGGGMLMPGMQFPGMPGMPDMRGPGAAAGGLGGGFGNWGVGPHSRLPFGGLHAQQAVVGGTAAPGVAAQGVPQFPGMPGMPGVRGGGGMLMPGMQFPGMPGMPDMRGPPPPPRPPGPASPAGPGAMAPLGMGILGGMPGYIGGQIGGTIGGQMGRLFGRGAGALLGKVGGPLGVLAGGLVGAGAAVGIGNVLGQVSPVQDELIAYDTLKRSLGDVGVSFDHLKNSIRATATGLDLTFAAAQQMAVEFTRISGIYGAQSRILDQQVQVAGGFARAYGLDPLAATRFFAQAQFRGVTDDDRDQRRLAIYIATAMGQVGQFPHMQKMLDAIVNFMDQQTPVGLARPNVEGFLAQATGLMNLRLPGLGAAGAGALLGQVNQAIMRGGHVGEPGQAFMFRLGGMLGLDPVQTMMLQEGGAFGTVRDLSRFREGVGLAPLAAATGPMADKPLAQLVLQQLRDTHAGVPFGLKIDAAARFFGTGHRQAAALLQADPADIGDVHRRLERIGIDPMEVQIPNLIRLVEAVGDPTKTDAEIRQMAFAPQQGTLGYETRESRVALQNLYTEIAGNLIPSLNALRNSVVSASEVVGKLIEQPGQTVAGAAGYLAERADQAVAQANRPIVEGAGNLGRRFGEFLGIEPHPDAYRLEQNRRGLQRQGGGQGGGMNARERLQHSRLGGGERALEVRRIMEATDRLIGAPPGTAEAQAFVESSWNPSAVGAAGERGLTQFMPRTWEYMEQKLGRDMDPENPVHAAIMQQKYLLHLRRRFGSYYEAILAYNAGGDRRNWNPEYLAKVHRNRPYYAEELPHSPQGPQPGVQTLEVHLTGELKATDSSGREYGRVVLQPSRIQVPDPR